MNIYCLPIHNVPWQDIETKLLPFVSPERQKIVLGYYHSIDQKLSLYAALLVRMELSKRTGIPAVSLNFSTQFLHKPLLLSAPEYQFNFSHTHNMILCGITMEGPIGVDVETINRNLVIENMEGILHPAEWQYINESDSFIRQIRFYEIWTKKESYVKFLGTGLSKRINNINILTPEFSSHIYTWQQDHYICSVFMPNQSKPCIKIISETDIHNYFFHLCQ